MIFTQLGGVRARTCSFLVLKHLRNPSFTQKKYGGIGIRTHGLYKHQKFRPMLYPLIYPVMMKWKAETISINSLCFILPRIRRFLASKCQRKVVLSFNEWTAKDPEFPSLLASKVLSNFKTSLIFVEFSRIHRAS